MLIASYIGLVVGLAIFIGLIVWQGIADLAGLLLSTGWALLLVPAIWFPTVLLNARCWQLLFAPPHGPRSSKRFTLNGWVAPSTRCYRRLDWWGNRQSTCPDSVGH